MSEIDLTVLQRLLRTQPEYRDDYLAGTYGNRRVFEVGPILPEQHYGPGDVIVIAAGRAIPRSEHARRVLERVISALADS
ncbi:MAG: hypothetical protein HY340_02140 [Candidatus Kerfeldbacteria bacterium]|nr:hypothetical protein [Candidatus Kerfeldbacteria bacterium]